MLPPVLISMVNSAREEIVSGAKIEKAQTVIETLKPAVDNARADLQLLACKALGHDSSPSLLNAYKRKSPHDRKAMKELWDKAYRTLFMVGYTLKERRNKTSTTNLLVEAATKHLSDFLDAARGALHKHWRNFSTNAQARDRNKFRTLPVIHRKIWGACKRGTDSFRKQFERAAKGDVSSETLETYWTANDWTGPCRGEACGEEGDACGEEGDGITTSFITAELPLDGDPSTPEDGERARKRRKAGVETEETEGETHADPNGENSQEINGAVELPAAPMDTGEDETNAAPADGDSLMTGVDSALTSISGDISPGLNMESHSMGVETANEEPLVHMADDETASLAENTMAVVQQSDGDDDSQSKQGDGDGGLQAESDDEEPLRRSPRLNNDDKTHSITASSQTSNAMGKDRRQSTRLKGIDATPPRNNSCEDKQTDTGETETYTKGKSINVDPLAPEDIECACDERLFRNSDISITLINKLPIAACSQEESRLTKLDSSVVLKNEWLCASRLVHDLLLQNKKIVNTLQSIYSVMMDQGDYRCRGLWEPLRKQWMMIPVGQDDAGSDKPPPIKEDPIKELECLFGTYSTLKKCLETQAYLTQKKIEGQNDSIAFVRARYHNCLTWHRKACDGLLKLVVHVSAARDTGTGDGAYDETVQKESENALPIHTPCPDEKLLDCLKTAHAICTCIGMSHKVFLSQQLQSTTFARPIAFLLDNPSHLNVRHLALGLLHLWSRVDTKHIRDDWKPLETSGIYDPEQHNKKNSINQDGVWKSFFLKASCVADLDDLMVEMVRSLDISAKMDNIQNSSAHADRILEVAHVEVFVTLMKKLGPDHHNSDSGKKPIAITPDEQSWLNVACGRVALGDNHMDESADDDEISGRRQHDHDGSLSPEAINSQRTSEWQDLSLYLRHISSQTDKKGVIIVLGGGQNGITDVLAENELHGSVGKILYWDTWDIARSFATYKKSAKKFKEDGKLYISPDGDVQTIFNGTDTDESCELTSDVCSILDGRPILLIINTCPCKGYAMIGSVDKTRQVNVPEYKDVRLFNKAEECFALWNKEKFGRYPPVMCEAGKPVKVVVEMLRTPYKSTDHIGHKRNVTVLDAKDFGHMNRERVFSTSYEVPIEPSDEDKKRTMGTPTAFLHDYEEKHPKSIHEEWTIGSEIVNLSEKTQKLMTPRASVAPVSDNYDKDKADNRKHESFGAHNVVKEPDARGFRYKDLGFRCASLFMGFDPDHFFTSLCCNFSSTQRWKLLGNTIHHTVFKHVMRPWSEAMKSHYHPAHV